MKLLLYKETHTGFKQINSLWLGGFAIALVALVGTAGVVGAHMFGVAETKIVEIPSVPAALAIDLDAELETQRAELATIQNDADAQVEAMTVVVAELQARLIRIEALGQKLTKSAKLSGEEFNFDLAPAMGGPEVATGSNVDLSQPSIDESLLALESQLASRENQLEVIEQLMMTDDLAAQKRLAGRPVKTGWMTSPFGKRRDPFNGRVRYHEGLDFAGQRGSDVVAIGGGIVSFSSSRSGYGLIVEINHGDGLVTRYAHNSKNVVDVGDRVNAGDVIAKMGSSGRSTGPHVHFEVLKDGNPVNPQRYTKRIREQTSESSSGESSSDKT